MIPCRVCSKEFKAITPGHLSTHGLSKDNYLDQYGGSLLSEETQNKLSNQLTIDWSNVDFNKATIELALELSITPAAVSEARRRLNASPAPGYKKVFIDWNNVALGSKPDTAIAEELGVSRGTVKNVRKRKNIPPFIGLILAQEGFPCRSLLEAKYDAYLHWKNLPHEHEVRVDGMPYIPDFLVEGRFKEIEGVPETLFRENASSFVKKYIEHSRLKKQYYIDNAVNVDWGLPPEGSELFKGCPLLLKFKEQRICDDCKKETHDLVKGYCRNCYMKRWHQNGTSHICASCGITFDSSHEIAKFCSHECYSENLELAWPSWEDIDEQLKTMPIRQLAFKLNIKPSSLYMRLRRRKLKTI